MESHSSFGVQWFKGNFYYMIVLQDFDNVQLSVYSSLESKQLIITDGLVSLTYRFDNNQEIDLLIDMLYNLKHSNNE